MTIYLAVLGIVMVLGCFVEIGKINNWNGWFVRGEKTYTLPLTNVFWALIFITLVLFGGLRYMVGTDFAGYCEIFDNIAADWYVETYAGTERGYVWMNRIISLFTKESQAVIFAANLVICWLGVAALRKYSRFAPFGLYIFFTTLYYNSFNLIRQGMAASFVFLALGYAADRKMVKSLLLVLAGSFFHKTALMMAPVMFLMQFSYKPVVYWLFYLLSAAASLSERGRDLIANQLIGRFYPHVANDAATFNVDFSPTQVILCGLYLLLCVYYRKKMVEKNKGNIVYINFSILIFSLYSIYFWLPMWSRLNMYFICMYALIVPAAIDCEESRRLKTLYYVILLGILLFFLVVPVLMGGGDWYYGTFFEKLAILREEALWP